MKFLIVFIISITSYAQTAQELRDMLNGNAFEKYEKMFESIIQDMEELDHSQFEQYNKLFDRSIMKQLQILGGQRRSYQWKEGPTDRTLVFAGRLDETAEPVIEIKDNFFEIKGTFINETNINGNKNISKTMLSLKVSLPSDIDSAKVKYENKENSFLVIFPKKSADKKPDSNKPIRSPIKENKSDVII